MPLQPRPRLRSFTAFAVTLLAVSAPLTVVAGDASTSTSGTSGRFRSSSPKATHHSMTTDDSELPGELEAWSFARENGRQRNSRGSERDWDEVERLLERDPGDVFWFRRSGERYVVTDAATLREIAELFAPQEELGRRQGELGRQQGELGRQQGALGRKQGQLGRIQARLGAQRAKLSLERSRRSRGETAPAGLEREHDEVSRLQSETGELQSRLGEEQAALGERQSELGERQAALGREQNRVSNEIARRLEELTAEWVRSGLARRVER